MEINGNSIIEELVDLAYAIDTANKNIAKAEALGKKDFAQQVRRERRQMEARVAELTGLSA